MARYKRDIDAFITNRALDLRHINPELSEPEIAELISKETGLEISRSVVHGRIYRHANRSIDVGPKPIMPLFEKYKDIIEGTRAAPGKINCSFERGPLKILVLNDLHTPFQHTEALEDALLSHRSADVVVTSEVSDMYSLSPFSKDGHVSFELEVEEILRWFEYLNNNFNISYVLNCGHERRVTRYITSRIRTDLLFLVKTDLVTVLAEPFERVVSIPNSYYTINDAIFTHLDKHSSVIPMRSSVKAHEWLQNWKSHLNISDYRVLIQSHSHKSGIVNYPTVQLVETGCLQKIPRWVMHRLPMMPWVHGYAVVYQNNGKTLRNETRVMVYECPTR